MCRDHLFRYTIYDIYESNRFNLSFCDLGDGVESQSLQESPKKSSSIVIPEDFESQKEMVRRVISV